MSESSARLSKSIVSNERGVPTLCIIKTFTDLLVPKSGTYKDINTKEDICWFKELGFVEENITYIDAYTGQRREEICTCIN